MITHCSDDLALTARAIWVVSQIPIALLHVV